MAACLYFENILPSVLRQVAASRALWEPEASPLREESANADERGEQEPKSDVTQRTERKVQAQEGGDGYEAHDTDRSKKRCSSLTRLVTLDAASPLRGNIGVRDIGVFHAV